MKLFDTFSKPLSLLRRRSPDKSEGDGELDSAVKELSPAQPPWLKTIPADGLPLNVAAAASKPGSAPIAEPVLAGVSVPGPSASPTGVSASAASATSAASQVPTAGPEVAQTTPPPTSAPAPEPAKDKKVDAKDDLLDLFTEDDKGNEELKRLVTGLPQVDMRELAQECREIVATLRSRRGATRPRPLP